MAATNTMVVTHRYKYTQNFYKRYKMRKLSDDAKKMRAEMKQLRDVTLPKYLEIKLMQNTDKAFDSEQYPGKTKWEQRSDKWGKKADKKQNGLARTERRGLLVGSSGDLRKSIETDTDKGEASIGTDVIYAQIHNEGLQGKVFGKHAFTMPQRQFMPIDEDAPFMSDVRNEVDEFIDNKIKSILG